MKLQGGLTRAVAVSRHIHATSARLHHGGLVVAATTALDYGGLMVMLMVHANRNYARASARAGASQGHGRLRLVVRAGITLRLDDTAGGL